MAHLYLKLTRISLELLTGWYLHDNFRRISCRLWEYNFVARLIWQFGEKISSDYFKRKKSRTILGVDKCVNLHKQLKGHS